MKKLFCALILTLSQQMYSSDRIVTIDQNNPANFTQQQWEQLEWKISFYGTAAFPNTSEHQAFMARQETIANQYTSTLENNMSTNQQNPQAFLETYFAARQTWAQQTQQLQNDMEAAKQRLLTGLATLRQQYQR